MTLVHFFYVVNFEQLHRSIRRNVFFTTDINIHNYLELINLKVALKLLSSQCLLHPQEKLKKMTISLILEVKKLRIVWDNSEITFKSNRLKYTLIL